MISRWLQGILAAEAVVLVVIAAQLMNGANPAAVAAALIAGLLALNFTVVAAIYAIVRLYAGTPPGGAETASVSDFWHAAGECLALLVQFGTIAPFERWWMGPDRVGPLPAGQLPVVLVPGYVCNRGLWWWLRRGLRAVGLAVATLNLEPPLASIDHFATQLHRRVEALLAETRASQVLLVTHSMGGLVARAYLQQYGSARIAKLVMLAAPHQGTLVARLGFGRNAREMEPDSQLLRRLNTSPTLPIPAVALWSRADEFVVPHDSARLPGAREYVLSSLGHIALTFSPAVLRILRKELTQPPSAPT